MRSLYCFVIILILSFAQIHGQIIHIPEDQPSIQAGIDASVSGDTVLVASGEYYENLNLNGKNIVLASHFILTGDVEDINQTIINGSQPVHSDTSSCILIVSGENESCIISGFTLTGGAGTRWEDEHNKGFYYTEGGGILIQYSSPIIRNNVIHDNTANKKNSRNTSSGGGAIRMGDSNPQILNNLIHHNEGRYGPGIVLNYSGAIIKNNLIFSNSGGRDFGGGGIWVLDNGDAPIIIENNTIVNNSVGSNYGGGVRFWSTEVVFTNNIVRGNSAKYGPQIHGSGSLAYCNVEGGRDGTEIIDEPIDFEYPLYYLPDGSSSIDAGNPHVSYNDLEDPQQSGHPMFPSQGTLRNDLGAYGGPGAQLFPEPDLSYVALFNNKTDLSFDLFPNPAEDFFNISLPEKIGQFSHVEITSLLGQLVYSRKLTSGTRQLILYPEQIGLDPGVYFVNLLASSTQLTQKLIVR